MNDNLDMNFWRSHGSSMIEVAIVFGVTLLVVVLVFIWATFWRKPGRRHYSRHQGASGNPAGPLPKHRRRRPLLFRVLRRHQCRRHRRRARRLNPTLAQVGGLPPQRREQPPTA